MHMIKETTEGKRHDMSYLWQVATWYNTDYWSEAEVWETKQEEKQCFIHMLLNKRKGGWFSVSDLDFGNSILFQTLS